MALAARGRDQAWQTRSWIFPRDPDFAAKAARALGPLRPPTRRQAALTPNDFATLPELARHLMDFGQHYRNIAPPFDWTFTRDDLARVLDKIADRQPGLQLAA